MINDRLIRIGSFDSNVCFYFKITTTFRVHGSVEQWKNRTIIPKYIKITLSCQIYLCIKHLSRYEEISTWINYVTLK